MNVSHFFIRRPIFAGVLSIVILLLGGLALLRLPISEYPDVVPPSIVVRAAYPGANPKTVAETVAVPLELAINGVERSLYMSSQSSSDGTVAITVTFQLGTDVDDAQVQVQNRVSQALPKLPEEVRRLGVTTTKQAPDLTMVAHIVSPNGRYDERYLRNFASLQVKDVLARIPGVGSVEVFGPGEYAMRVWLDPDRIAALGLTAAEVVQAIREQNVQVAAGGIGQEPQRESGALTLQINTQGRLVDEEQFGAIIVRTGANGQMTLLSDVARLELGSASYSIRSLLDNEPAIALPIFQAPGANALELSEHVREALQELKADFPDGVDYRIVYDPTVFVRKSIQAVITTLLEAVALVVIVVLLFLQTWRASLIPLAAVPVSLVGTFAVMLALGFSINALSLFGLVLAIGIVVDDAIVVVENVERNIALGLSPFDATKRAMNEVTGPIIATALVLCAVFIPTAFISGLTGQFYKQFAITIAVSTVISAFNSLTLSPALAAVLLRDHHAKKDWLTRIIDALFGWFFRPFNRAFAWAGDRYAGTVSRLVRFSLIALIAYAGLLYLTRTTFDKVPAGFVPTQDKQYVVAFAQLPEAASLDRTEAVIRRMTDIALKQPGVEHAVAFPGLSINGFAAATNAGAIFFCLDPFEERSAPELSGLAIVEALNREFGVIQEAFVLAVPPPPVNGLGALGGFKLYVQDRADVGYDELYRQTQALLGKSWQAPELAGVFSTFTVNVPQLDADIDRVKAKTTGVSLSSVFETLQIYLGSLYVNDFNRFGRTYQVIAQADDRFRDEPTDITRFQVRNAAGDMVPLVSLVTVRDSYGPDRVIRYNGFPAAEITGGASVGHSSGEAETRMAEIALAELPKGLGFEWTELTYQRILAGNTAIYIYPLCLLLVFLVLAAQYESLRLPLAILLIVPLCVLFAFLGVHWTDGDNNVFTQIGLIVLVGLACKNAILIVEFAKARQDEGLDRRAAAVEASRLRLRPILMTSIAFVAGVWPLVASTGAGAEMRRAMGVAVFSGMIGVTLCGLLLTPVFYSVLMRGKSRATQPTPRDAPSGGSSGAQGGVGADVAHRSDGAATPATHGGGAGAAGAGPILPAAGGLLLALALGFGAGCRVVGPDYARPALEVPPSYASDAPAQAAPALEPAWWTVYADAHLHELELRADVGNQQLRAAAARLAQGLALARGAREQRHLSASIDANAARTRYSPNAGLAFPIEEASNLRIPLNVRWEADLYGRIARSIEANERGSEALAANLESVRLLLQAEVASTWFTLRSIEVEQQILVEALAWRHKALGIVRTRLDAGAATQLDVARAEAEQAAAEVELAALARERLQTRNALAVLVGSPASTFDARGASQRLGAPPAVPAGLPSQLLERRPDIVAAERELAARNASIGIAEAAYFPSLSLTGYAGVESKDLGGLFDWDSRIWSVGPSLYLPLFQRERLDANLERVRAEYDEGVANYRQSVLVAFREVQDALGAEQELARQAEALARVIAAGRRAAGLARTRYDSGYTSYLDVIDAERTLLDAERAAAGLEGLRWINSVQLIKALGGGWDGSVLPELTATAADFGS
jgi:multidrug efflux pump